MRDVDLMLWGEWRKLGGRMPAIPGVEVGARRQRAAHVAPPMDAGDAMTGPALPRSSSPVPQPTWEQYKQLREALDFIAAVTRDQKRGLKATEVRMISAVANDRVVHQVARDTFPNIAMSRPRRGIGKPSRFG